jgi:D-arabinitol dehydrogenase (NADP+)
MDRADAAASVPRLRELAPHGFDVVVDATGAAPVVGLTMQLTKDGGTIFIYGMCDERERVPFSPYEIFRRQLTVKGSFAQTHCFDRALVFLRGGRVRTEGIVTHRFPLDEYGQALQALRSDPRCLKAAIVV